MSQWIFSSKENLRDCIQSQMRNFVDLSRIVYHLDYFFTFIPWTQIFHLIAYISSNLKFYSLLSHLIFEICLFYRIYLSNQYLVSWKIIRIIVDERMCGYLVIWGYVYKNSPKQINHLSISLYTAWALMSSFINLGHLGETIMSHYLSVSL